MTTLTDNGYADATLVAGGNGMVGAVLTTYFEGGWNGQRFNAFH